MSYPFQFQDSIRRHERRLRTRAFLAGLALGLAVCVVYAWWRG